MNRTTSTLRRLAVLAAVTAVWLPSAALAEDGAAPSDLETVVVDPVPDDEPTIEPDPLPEPEPDPDPDDGTDSDSDGLTDRQESDFGSDPGKPDSDGDGFSDGAEVFEHGTDPTDATSNLETLDSDGDGVPDKDDPTPYGDEEPPVMEPVEGGAVEDGEVVVEVTTVDNPDVLGPTVLPAPVPSSTEALPAAPEPATVAAPSALPATGA